LVWASRAAFDPPMKFATPELGRDIDYDRVYEPAGTSLRETFFLIFVRGLVLNVGCFGKRR
jgi:hypothetical protein